MKKIFDFVFSMKFAGTLILIFAAVIGTATFIENDYGTMAARTLVYNSTWFELLLLLTGISLIGSIFKYKLYRRQKLGVLMFHFAFIIILLGAAITRFFGYEGIMNIREGESSNMIMSDNTYVQVWIKDGQQETFYDHPYYFSVFKTNRFSKTIEAGGEEYDIQFKEFIPHAAKTIVEDPDGNPFVSLVTMSMGDRQNYFIESGELAEVNGVLISFKSEILEEADVNISFTDDTFRLISPHDMVIRNMMENTVDTLSRNKFHNLETLKLYNIDGKNIVFNNLYKSAKTKIVSAHHGSRSSSVDAVIFEVSSQGQTIEIVTLGSKNILGEPVEKVLGNISIAMAYGSKNVEIPFSLHLDDFQLERYPGSMSPSSFASDVTVIDERKGLELPYRIFMNNVLNYGGYRFFQSSYDKDEKGTILSVNKDAWGTIITYIGYFFLAFGMFLNFFSRYSRFRTLARVSSHKKSIRNAAGILLLGVMALPAFSQTQDAQMGHGMDHSQLTDQIAIDKEHAAKFGELLVQDRNGRIKPINTMSAEILRKVYRKDMVLGLNADQVFLSMLVNPGLWQAIPMIKVSDDELKKYLGVTGKYASFNDFIDMSDGSYKLSRLMETSHNKKPAEKTGLDKDVIKVDERVNIIYMVYTGDFLTIFPKPGDENNKWYPATNADAVFDSTDAGFVRTILPLYYSAIMESTTSGDWAVADEYLSYLKTFQERYGSEIFPSSFKTNLEISYNKINLFKRLFPYYALTGLIFLIFLFVNVINRKNKFKIVERVLIYLIAFGFLLHTIGLAARWYIGGHAPWSNGYETMIYIAWALLLSGFIFLRKSKISLATTAILASLTLMVANLSWLDPEITNLVPVLKSYWLVIHVAVITASYSFLAIGALLGFLNLMLINFQNKNNFKKLNETIKEITNINEMNLIIGVFLITIGTFLGAVWANESWGRYWGWDPKETWALVTVLVYSFVVHMRMIPGLNGVFAFNFASLISFSSVLMTYFGVNYYLSGLHSYAQGDPVPIPMFVYYTFIIIFMVSIMAYVNYRRMQKSGNSY